MTEQWQSSPVGSSRTLRLRTDDGPIVELALTADVWTLAGTVTIYDVPQGQPISLADLSSCVVRERRGVAKQVAAWANAQNADDTQLWTAMATLYANRKTRWDKAAAAATAAATAAGTNAGVDLTALTAAFQAAVLPVLP